MTENEISSQVNVMYLCTVTNLDPHQNILNIDSNLCPLEYEEDLKWSSFLDLVDWPGTTVGQKKKDNFQTIEPESHGSN